MGAARDRLTASFLRAFVLAGAVLIAASSGAVCQEPAYTEEVLYRFCLLSNCSDGANPFAGLIMDQTGTLYGATPNGGNGGTTGGGAVFSLAPSGDQAWTETILYPFLSQSDFSDGSGPYSTLIMDPAGNLYGTAGLGGAFYQGVVFELTPDESRTAWTETVLYSFCSQADCADGFQPVARLIMDEAGNLFGTTQYTGDPNTSVHGGTVFKLTPSTDGTGWTAAILYRFCSESNCADGDWPYGGLVRDQAGNLYGTTILGGAANGGTVFELSPDPTQTEWTQTVLYDFCSAGSVCPDGRDPEGDLIMDEAGSLYGTTLLGGTGGIAPFGGGTVFKLTPDGAARPRCGTGSCSGWTETVIYNACSEAFCADGTGLVAGLLIDGAGSLYGATSYSIDQSTNTLIDGGAIFKLTADAQQAASIPTILYRFCSNTDCADGAQPYGTLIMDEIGNLYGTTVEGGQDYGVVFKLTPR